MRAIKTFIPIAAAAACLLATAPSASAACTGSTSAPYAAAVTSTPGLVSYWRLGESSGTSACDSSGSNAGTYAGGVTLGSVGALSGDPDTAITLDGATGQVTVPHASPLDVGDTFTIEAWVKRGSVSSSGNQVIASQQSGSWVLMFNPSNRLVLRRATVGDLVQSTTTVTDSGWHHVAATKGGSSVHLYVDGTDVTGTVADQTLPNNTQPLVIGQSSGTAFYRGTIDEVALYNAALSASTVKTHFDKGAVAPSPTPTPITSPYPVIGAAGDIACDPDDYSYNGGDGTAIRCRQKATSNLVVNTGLSGIVTLGDEQYEDATLGKFQTSYQPTWGRANSLAHPGVGNHEYWTPGAAGYFDYFNGVGNQNGPAGPRGKGYYSFNLGSWHIVELNSNCGEVSCAAGSAQEQWLRSDLARNPTACTAAIWHHPRFSSGVLGNHPELSALYNDLYNARVDLLLTGHDHVYERFAPQTPSGIASSRGIREFIVGTGGESHTNFSLSAQPNSQVRQNTTFGILRLALRPQGYDWQFVPEAGQSFTDSGSASCI